MVHQIANPKAKKEFVLPVEWSVFSKIKVQANTLEEAYEWAQEHIDEIPLSYDDETCYIDGSYEVGSNDLDYCRIYNEKIA